MKICDLPSVATHVRVRLDQPCRWCNGRGYFDVRWFDRYWHTDQAICPSCDGDRHEHEWRLKEVKP